MATTNWFENESEFAPYTSWGQAYGTPRSIVGRLPNVAYAGTITFGDYLKIGIMYVPHIYFFSSFVNRLKVLDTLVCDNSVCFRFPKCRLPIAESEWQSVVPSRREFENIFG